MSSDFEKREECFCKSKCFKKFLTIALGSFVGMYCALALFCALHRPPMMHPMMPMPYYGAMMPHNAMNCNCPCHKMMMKKMMKHHMFDKNRPNMEDKKPEIDD